MKTRCTMGEMAGELEQLGFAPVLSGSGADASVFVEVPGRAVELSEYEGQWVAEFWKGSAEGAVPVKERAFASDRDALQAIAEWLLR